MPQCALAIEDVLRRAGFAEGVFQTLLVGSGKIEAILSDARVRAATLTGSEPAGRAVGAVAGRMVKPSVLELGGSDAFIVMPSADLDDAVDNAVTSRTLNNGQSCINAKRFIVHEQVADEFERKMVAKMEALRVGDPMDPDTDMGPLATPDGVETVDQQVRDTVAAGARVLTGGKPLGGQGNFYPPTVLTDIPDGSPGHREEIFGPVALAVARPRRRRRHPHRQRLGLRARRQRLDPGPRRAGAVRRRGRDRDDVHQQVHRVDAGGALRRHEELRIRPGAGGVRPARVRQRQDGVDRGIRLNQQRGGAV